LQQLVFRVHLIQVALHIPLSVKLGLVLFHLALGMCKLL
jgi:hypothetical protein